MSRRLLILSALLLAVALPPRSASASLEATPFMGAMIPANSQLIYTTGSTIFRMQTHTIYGLSLGSTVTRNLGAELVLATGTGKLELVGGADILQFASTVFIADLRGHLRLLGDDTSQLAAVLGAGYTDFNIGLFDLAHEAGQGTFVGRATGIAGVELRHQVAERARLSMVLVDRVHADGIGLDAGSTSVIRKTQNDLTVTLGLNFGL